MGSASNMAHLHINANVEKMAVWAYDIEQGPLVRLGERTLTCTYQSNSSVIEEECS